MDFKGETVSCNCVPDDMINVLYESFISFSQ